MDSSSNSGKYILPVAVVIIILNILLIGFLFLNEKGYFSFSQTTTPSNVGILDNEDLDNLVSAPVSAPIL